MCFVGIFASVHRLRLFSGYGPISIWKTIQREREPETDLELHDSRARCLVRSEYTSIYKQSLLAFLCRQIVSLYVDLKKTRNQSFS